MKKKLHVALICGGKSPEHEISLLSAQTILQELDPKKYVVTIIGIDKQGSWFFPDKKLLFSHIPGILPAFVSQDITPQQSISSILVAANQPVDVLFPVLHGPHGEDGTIQGLCKMINIPCVGSGILGSAISMDKDVAKRLLRDAGIATTKFLVFHQEKKHHIQFANVVKQIGLPIFVKPSNLGSSVGVSKVTTQKEFLQAIDLAFSFDTKILIEQEIKGREIIVSVLGTIEKMIASLPGEITTDAAFYSYHAKYLDAQRESYGILAHLSPQIIKKVQHTAIKVCQTLCLEGMGQVEGFLTPSGKFYINEVNTIPGFTQFSMYPKLWETSGITYRNLLDIVIDLAVKKFQKENVLKTSLN